MTIYGIRDHVTVGSEGKGQGNPVEFRDFARPDVETRAQSARLISKGYREHRCKWVFHHHPDNGNTVLQYRLFIMIIIVQND